MNNMTFSYWCQFVLPTVYDDSLSYYEVLCKLGDGLALLRDEIDQSKIDVKLQEALATLNAEVTTALNNIDSAVVNEIDRQIDLGVIDGQVGGEAIGWINNPVYGFYNNNPIKITCMGDSLTYGSDPTNTDNQVVNTYPKVLSTLLNRYGSATVINNGVQGETTTEAVSRLNVISNDTNICIFMYGTNDINHGVSPSVIVANTITFITYCLNRNITPIICTPPALYRPDNTRRSRHDTVARLVKLICTVLSVQCVDVYAWTLKWISDCSVTIPTMADGTHWTDYTQIAGIIYHDVFNGICTSLDTPFTEGIRNNGVVTSAGLVTPSYGSVFTYRQLSISDTDEYIATLFIPQYSTLYVVGDGIRVAGSLVIEVGNQTYVADTNNGLTESASCRVPIANLPAGIYPVTAKGVRQGSSTASEDFKFYLNGFYVAPFSSVSGGSSNYATESYVDDAIAGNNTELLNTVADTYLTKAGAASGYLPSSTLGTHFVQFRNVTSASVTVSAGGDGVVTVACPSVSGFSSEMATVVDVSSAGVFAEEVTISGTTISARMRSVRSSSATVTVTFRVMYLKE